MDNSKCVYLHRIGNTVVYVGSGAPSRVKGKNSRARAHLSVWDQLEFEVVYENLTTSEANVLEKNLITHYSYSGNLLNVRKTVHDVKHLDWELFNQFFYYDDSSPSGLRNKVTRSSVSLKDEVSGSSSNNSYYKVTFNKKVYLAHRIVYCILNSENVDVSLVIDHIDGNPKNNTIKNLRIVSQSVNQRNRKHKLGTTGFQNISEYENLKYFSVKYRYNSKRIGKTFGFNVNSQKAKNNPNLYQTRELALQAALVYRQTLVDKGLIVITSDKESNGQ